MSRDRFTEKDEKGRWAVTLGSDNQFLVEYSEVSNRDGSKTCTPTMVYAPFIDRLAEYEDLIFSPETLKAIIAEWKEWADAKNDGRLIVLPVVEGTPLFVDGARFASHCKGEIHVVRDWYYSNPMIYKDFRGEHDYAIDPESIVESVFLTREEAEKALKK